MKNAWGVYYTSTKLAMGPWQGVWKAKEINAHLVWSPHVGDSPQRERVNGWPSLNLTILIRRLMWDGTLALDIDD